MTLVANLMPVNSTMLVAMTEAVMMVAPMGVVMVAGTDHYNRNSLE